MGITTLQPLGLGELLDRAIGLFVRHFAPIALVVAIAYVPFLFVQWATIGHVVSHRPQPLRRDEWTSVGLDVALGMIVFGFTRTAVAAVAHARYMSRRMSLAAAYRAAVARFPAQIFAMLAAGAIECVIVLFAGAIPVIAVALVATAGGGAGTVPILIALGLSAIAVAILSAWLCFSYELATVRIAYDARSPYSALFSSIGATVFQRPWRSLLGAVILVLLIGGGSLMFSLLGELSPWPALRIVITFGLGGVGSILIEALSAAFLIAYDVDIAIRRGGLDLAVALDALTEPPG
jgi:hypothetical protein